MEKINPIYSPSFGIKIKTESVLETTAGKIFYNIGTNGFKEVYTALGNTKFPGHLGYAKQTRPIAQEILKRYPEIAKATDEITDIVKKNPKLKKSELAQKIQPIIDRFGETIDIVI
ncbi:hypothetical protein IKR55_03320 [bacterium]|nr:hypothetical protein [bacterium]